MYNDITHKMNPLLLEIFDDIKLIMKNDYFGLNRFYSLKDLDCFFRNSQKNASYIQTHFQQMTSVFIRMYRNSCKDWQKNKTIYTSLF